MSNMIDRVSNLEVYKQLLKTPFMTTNELANELGKDIEAIELSIASLREMYKEKKIDKYVHSSSSGYYLTDLNEVNQENIVNQNDENVLTLDIKNQANNKLLKINVVDENDISTFSITINLS